MTRACAAVLLVLSCNRSPANLEERTARAEPFVADFLRFERWALRALSANAERRDRDAQQEALFSPLGLESSVLGARVTSDREYRFRVPAEVDGWQRVRVGREELDVSWTEETLSLGRTHAQGSRSVRVELSFRVTEETEEPDGPEAP
ncbi:MAG: hypothetical protein AAGE52_40075 [Myxococcota bacterium]